VTSPARADVESLVTHAADPKDVVGCARAVGPGTRDAAGTGAALRWLPFLVPGTTDHRFHGAGSAVSAGRPPVACASAVPR